MTPALRDLFDAMLEAEIEALPPGVRSLLEEVPVIVEDHPDEATLRELNEEKDGLLGLHTGIPFTEQSVEDSGAMPGDIRLYRDAIVDQAGGWDAGDDHAAVREQIHITLLHEIGHQFGLDEDDLGALGFE